MNPVLLKPSTDIGAQVIVHGKVVDSMQAQQFHDYKKTAMQAVLDSHQRLSEQYQKIVVEGAGSPAEINLREGDIANMGFAEAVDCPVILLADIDRGGVFAHLVGTLDVLVPSEQDRIVGFVINKFRGDPALLDSGLAWLEQRTGKPVLGVLPFLPDFYLDAEDAISIDQVTSQECRPFTVVVPVLPRISNHTDFDALRLHPDVNLQFVPANQPPPPADLIVLPGSKNVISDLQTLKASGWHTALQRHLRYGGKVLGLCGGYQMLGCSLADPSGIESRLLQTEGFGLLPVQTTLHPEKQLISTQGVLAFDESVSVVGYEIHCGVSEPIESITALKPFCYLDQDRRSEGAVSSDSQVAGTYLHGVFDEADACNAILTWAGLNASNAAVDLSANREQQLDRLADMLESHLSADFLTWLNKTGHDGQYMGKTA